MKSVICAIVKNELRFIREWVEYYLNVGFDKLYIYEDYGSNTHYNEIEDYINEDKVELINLQLTQFIPRYKGTLIQSDLYSKFLKKCKTEQLADWIGFFDVDEFIMFEDGWNLLKLEEDFDDYGGILLSWKIYGSNKHIKRPKGNIVDNYLTHMPEGFLLDDDKQWNVKSLVNVKNCSGKKHIHVFNNCVFTDNKDLNSGYLTFQKAWINHYYTKSWEDYLNRIFSRGNMLNNFRSLDLFFKCNPEFTEDLKKEMIFAQRNKHCAGTMYISRLYKLISGGNINKLEQLRKKYIE